MLYVALYIATVVVCNAFYQYMPTVDLGPLGATGTGALVIGLVFVFRDYVQRVLGHYVLLCMLVATVLSFLLSDPYVAIASALAFAASELCDWALFTITKKPFHKRVLLSSLASTPVDTTVFLLYLNDMTPGTFLVAFIGKMLTAVAIFLYYEAREKQQLA